MPNIFILRLIRMEIWIALLFKFIYKTDYTLQATKQQRDFEFAFAGYAFKSDPTLIDWL